MSGRPSGSAAGIAETKPGAAVRGCGGGGAVGAHLNKENSLQRLGQVVVAAQQRQLLLGAQLPPQHAGFLQLLQLLPGAEHIAGSHKSSRHFLTQILHILRLWF